MTQKIKRRLYLARLHRFHQMRHGGMTLQAIADLEGISKSRTKQILDKAVRELRAQDYKTK
jgi:DNA-directed RNA polymerase sigma subunit (sigma70/sigma32)